MFCDAETDGFDPSAWFDASPNPYVVFDTRLRIVRHNAAYLKEVGRGDGEELIGRHVFDVFPSKPGSEGPALLKASLDKVLATGRPDQLALIPYDTGREGEPDGMRYWSATHTPLFDAAGRVRHILQHTTDVTEWHRLRGTARGMMAGAGVMHRAHEVQSEIDAVRREGDRLRALFRQAPGFMAVLRGGDHVFELANCAYEELVGRRNLVGRSVADALPEVVEQGFLDLLDTVWRSGKAYVGRDAPVSIHEASGEKRQRWLDFVYQPIFGDGGEVAGIFVQGNDITEQHAAQQALARQTEVLTLAQEAGGFGTFDWDLESDMLSVSATFAALYGLPPGEHDLPAEAVRACVHPDDRAMLVTREHGGVGERLKRTEYRVGRGNAVRWVARQGVVLRDAQGRPTRILGAVHDVTERKRAEEQLETLAHESAHRAKNMLTLVQAIVSQTLRRARDVESVERILTDRLKALGAAQAMLTGGKRPTSDLKAIAHEAMRLHAGETGRISIDGPSVALDARTALGAALVLHELGTNANKYGALSGEGGQVDIRWSLREDEPVLLFRWAESGGPPVRPPESRGFGSTLIERGLRMRAGNRVTLDYPPEGLVCRWELRLD